MIDNIYLSRDTIKKKLIQYLAKILEVNEEQLDTSETSFSSFIINALSTLASNSLLYGSLVYNESTLVTANLPESIINWSRYLDYTPQSAKSSTTDVLIKVPLLNNFSAIIGKKHKFYANDIVFMPKYDYVIDFTTGIKIYKIVDETTTQPLPYSLISEDDIQYVAFTIPVYQEDEIIEEFTIPTLKPFEFYTQTLDIRDGFVKDVKVYINDEEWKPGRIIFADSTEKVFEWIVIDNKLKLVFGNNLLGKQPNGIAKVVLTVTKGQDGNVASGTIVKGDPLYTTETPPRRVDYKVINPISATGGRNIDPLIDIKRNAPKALSMLHRIVSYNDFVNIFDIIYGEDIQVIPIMKRSDIAVNDILLYMTLSYQGEIVPTNSIWIPYDSTVKHYNMFSEFTFDGKQWICPFVIDIIEDKFIAQYTYIPNEIPLVLNTTYKSSNAKCQIINAKAVYNYNTNIYTLKFNVVIEDTTLTYTQDLKIRLADSINTYTPTRIETPLPNVIVFEYDIPRDEIVGHKSIDINTYQNSELALIDITSFEEVDLTKVSTSQLYKRSDDTIIITDIPVILKDWFDTLSEDQKHLFVSYIVSHMLGIQSNLENRIMNTNINIKFVKSYGSITNIQYSKPDYYVKQVVHSSTEVTSPEIGSMYAISDPVPSSDPWYQYAGYIAVWGGSDWSFFKPGTGTIVRNESDGMIYATDGRRWIIPTYKIPLKFDIEIFASRITGLESVIKQTLKDYVNNIGIDKSLYISKIMDILHNIPDVRFARIITPSTDIVYKDIIKNLTADQLAVYVPEYIYTTDDNIRLSINIT